MKPIKARQSSKVQHLVPNNPQADLQLTKGTDWDSRAEAAAKKRTLYDAAYRTATGHWKDRDEPDEAEQFRQSDRIQQILSAKRKQAAQDLLKSKNAVPTRDGRKLFDEFMKEANAHRPFHKPIETKWKSDDLQNIYNAASALEFEKWKLFLVDLLDSRI